MTKRDPINPTDDAAIALAQELIGNARHCALAVSHPDTQTPYVSRSAFVDLGAPNYVGLISDLSLHSRALQADPACSVLLGTPGDKGDPLTYPRITLICRAEFIDKSPLKTRYLAACPKAQLYFEFTDFRMIRFHVDSAHLHGGFGKAYHLKNEDLQAPRSA